MQPALTRRPGLSRGWGLSTVLILVGVTLLLGWTPARGSSEETDATKRYYAHWLKEVAPLIKPREVKVFARLETDAQREAFIAGFWKIRDPDPSTGANSVRDRFRRNSQLAWNYLENPEDDRFRTIILHGTPRYAHVIECAPLHPIMLFHYPRDEGRAEGFVVLFFIDSRRSPLFRLWSPGDGHARLAHDPAMSELLPEVFLNRVAEKGCFTDREHLQGFLAGALSKAHGWKELQRMASFPNLTSELVDGWLDEFKTRLKGNGGVPLPKTIPSSDSLVIGFPRKADDRTVFHGVLDVSATTLEPWLERDPAATTISLLGYVLPQPAGGQREADSGVSSPHEERFRQQIHLGARTDATDPLEIHFYQDLVPGVYTLVLRLEDPDGELLLRNVVSFEVPSEPVEGPERPAAAGAVNLVPSDLALLDRSQTVQILPLSGLLVGEVTIEVATTGVGIAEVRYDLDGKAVGRSLSGPWSSNLDLGPALGPHTVRAVAIDGAGREVAEDTLHLNAGLHRFAVRLIEPKSSGSYAKELRASAVVEVPRGATLDRVELFRNEDPIATIYQAPFVQSIPLDEPHLPAYIRVVAHLSNGSSTEDLVVVNAPGVLDRIDVREVELFASISGRRGHPVTDLSRQEVHVVEEGVSQQVLRLEPALDLPLRVGFLIDGSESMRSEMPRCIETALSFLGTVMGSKDEAAVITFDVRTTLAVPFTGDVEWLSDGVRSIVPSGGTSLWDGVVNTLNYFGGLEGRRAIILITDGEDQQSRFSFEDSVGFAQRSGVSVYTLYLSPSRGYNGDLFKKGIPNDPFDRERNGRAFAGRLRTLSEKTGGLFFEISGKKEIKKAFEAIERDLRSRYLIAYRSSNQGEGFRSVELQFDRPGVEARSVGGYYP